MIFIRQSLCFWPPEVRDKYLLKVTSLAVELFGDKDCVMSNVKNGVNCRKNWSERSLGPEKFYHFLLNLSRWFLLWILLSQKILLLWNARGIKHTAIGTHYETSRIGHSFYFSLSFLLSFSLSFFLNLLFAPFPSVFIFIFSIWTRGK